MLRELYLKPWMEQLSIMPKDLQIQRIAWDNPLTWATRHLCHEVERQYNGGLPVRIIVLKARQLGISTGTEGVLFNWSFLHPGTRGLIIAHETAASTNLFGMAKLMWETWPFRQGYTERHNTIKSLSWAETRSTLQVATARNAGSGRSFTYHAVHASECAFWEQAGGDPETLMNGLNQSMPYKPGTIQIIESTANGAGGWFYDEWNRAVEGKSNFVPLFFPWHKHSEYSFPRARLRQTELTRPERDLQKQYSLTLPQLAWRRHTIETQCMGDENKFRQEYPNDPEEAFLATGLSVFPGLKLLECFDEKKGIQGMLNRVGRQVEFVPDPDGPLTVFAWPADHREWGKYVVAGDPTRSTYGDPACAQVLNRRTMEQVAVWRGRIDPIDFADVLLELGWYYNEALSNTEIDGPGYATIAGIMRSGYPNIWRHRWADKAPGKVSLNYGWLMSRQRKHLAKALVIDCLSKHRLKIHDRITFDEMRDYKVLNEWGEMGASDGNDDTVTSMMIAVASTLWETPLEYPQGEEEKPVTNDFFDQPPWEAYG